MRYFKLIQNNKIIGAINNNDFFSYSPISHLLYPTLESDGEYVNCNNRLYRDYWMLPPKTNKYQYENVDIVEISLQEYEALYQAIAANEEIMETVQETLPITNPTIFTATVNNDSITIDFVRTSKINEMSRTCNQVIEAGFDLELNGKVEHFSLTTQDQLNLISLSSMAANGMEAIPYHADGEICRFYSNAEMQAIVAQATAFKIYHTTYYNALKNYINSLETIEEIAAVTYGMPLPEEYQSDVLKSLQK